MRMLSSTWYNCKGPIWLKEKENHEKKQQKKRMKVCKALNKGFEPLDTIRDMKVQYLLNGGVVVEMLPALKNTL
uniref:Uncharacterized protein n=1 Tax=Amphimedon queenslandica TaxID=400682 RepID=A0A1X7TNY4_AMPQE